MGPSECSDLRDRACHMCVGAAVLMTSLKDFKGPFIFAGHSLYFSDITASPSLITWGARSLPHACAWLIFIQKDEGKIGVLRTAV